MGGIEAGKRCAATVYQKVIIFFLAVGGFNVFVHRNDMDALAGSLAGLVVLLALFCGCGFAYGFVTSASSATPAIEKRVADAHEIAGREILNNWLEPGAWARAVASTDGDNDLAKSAYVKARVSQLELQTQLTEAARLQETEAARREKVEQADARYRAEKAKLKAEDHRLLDSRGYKFGQWLGRKLAS